MSNQLDSAPFEVPCPYCKKKIKKTLGWFDKISVSCPYCGGTIETKQFQSELSKVRESLSDLERSLGKLNIKLWRSRPGTRWHQVSVNAFTKGVESTRGWNFKLTHYPDEAIIDSPPQRIVNFASNFSNPIPVPATVFKTKCCRDEGIGWLCRTKGKPIIDDGISKMFHVNFAN